MPADSIPSRTATSRALTPIGRTDSSCPYCGATLAKRPSRKAKCPHCSTFVYVRTRPLDRQRVLLTESDLPTLEAQWAQINLDSVLSRFDELGLTPDQQWARCNRDLLEHAKKADWGLYRNTRLHMATLLHREGRSREALVTYLEVSYLDLNGPQNMGGVTDHDIIRDFPPFSKADSMLASAVLEWTRQVAADMGLEPGEIERLFMDMGNRVHSKLRLPVATEDAWRDIKSEVEMGDA